MAQAQHGSGAAVSPPVARRPRLRSPGRRAYGMVLRLCSVIILLLGWQVVSWIVGTDIFPPPLDIVSKFRYLFSSGMALPALGQTLVRTSLCFACAFILALVYGVSATRIKLVDSLTKASFGALLYLPSLVIVFIAITTLSNLPVLAVIILAATAVAPQLSLYVKESAAAIDPRLTEMSAAFHVSPRGRITGLYLPHLAPTMLTIFRVGFNNSWKVIALAEVFGLPSGIGSAIRLAYGAYDMAQVLAWLVIFVAVLVVVEQLIRLIESRVITWR